ncbi:MAG TPA: hypothetical protein VGO00_10145, partial [Kofleriaceae bacterium]|nr:hypothetical protein [Kofleriaceae bacterium]
VRERDEVKQMLDEARDYADWVERRPERRARQRRIAISVFTTAALVIAGVGYVMVSGHRAREFDQAFEKFSGFTDEMCACTTKACADGVDAEITRWAETLVKHDKSTETPSSEDVKRFTVVSERYSKCLIQLESN